MDFSELILEAMSTLTLNKLRTGLATLGIVIGIGSVIALVSLGQSSQQAVSQQIQSLGSNLLSIVPGSKNSGVVRGAAGGATTLTYEDALAIENSTQVTAVKKVSSEYSGREQVTTSGSNTNTQVVGVTPNYEAVHKTSIASGTFITQRDLDSQTRVAVVGPQVVTDLFGEGADPIGKTIRIGNQSFRIIGVTVAKGGTGFQNQDDIVFVPLTTAQKQIFGINNLTGISIEAIDENSMVQAQDEIGYLLLARHKISDPSLADFSIVSQSDIIGAASQVTGTFTSLLSGIAAISLVVGGIGIMNIMLVTVTERTREVGLRKALGAKKKIITYQFLIESVILTFAGGIIGMIIGIGASAIISSVIGLPFTISVSSIFLAIGVSAAIGILFGWYPAAKAAALQPIEALRYE